MPGQDRVWRDDRGNSLQYPSAEWSPRRRKSAALIVRQAHSVAAGLNRFFQDAVLFDQIVDHTCLLATQTQPANVAKSNCNWIVERIGQVWQGPVSRAVSGRSIFRTLRHPIT